MLTFYLTLIEGEEEEEKFTVLYTTWRDLILRVAGAALHDARLSEDAVHDAFLYIARNIRKIGDPRSRATKAYLLLLTDSCAKKILRARKEVLNENLIGFYDVDNTTAEDAFFERYNETALKDAVASLPEAYRTPLLLKYAGGYKSAEIAGIMGIRPDAVRKRLERAKKLLREALEKEEAALQ